VATKQADTMVMLTAKKRQINLMGSVEKTSPTEQIAFAQQVD